MYKIQDAHSFWNWSYFVVLILVKQLDMNHGTLFFEDTTYGKKFILIVFSIIF